MTARRIVGARRVSALMGVALAASLLPSGPASGAPAASGVEHRSVADELVVGYQPGATPTQRAGARSRAGAQLKENVVAGQGQTGAVELVRLPAGSDRGAAERRIEQDPAVAYAEPNWIYTHAATSNDPYYTGGNLWGMYGDATTPANQYGSQAGEAWAAGNTGSADVYVGVIDEGIQFTHPDLAGQVWTNPYDTSNGVDDDGNGYVDDLHGWDFAGNNNSIYDGGSSGNVDDHGTHVSGTIGAKSDGAGVVGMNWNVTLISGKFLGSNGGTTSNAIKAVDYFTNLKIRHNLNIVATNNSWGGGGYSSALFDAISRANNAGILFIAAAGNSGSNNDTTASYPSNYDVANVIAVAAIDDAGALASFSQYGAQTVDLAAPGVGVVSTTAYNSYSSYNGTSMATPHVTGAAALYKAANPTASAAAIKNAILSSVVPTTSLTGKTVTGGRLDVSSFVGTSSTSPPPPAPATAPSAPQNLTAIGNVGSIALSWAAPQSNGGSDVTGYNVYRGHSLVGSTGALSFSHPVTAGIEYSYFVRAVNAVGESIDSNTASATATASEPVARVVTLVVGAKKKNSTTPVTVNWSGFSGVNVNVTRSGGTFSTANDGTLTENWRGGGTITYMVCDTGSSTACASASTTI
ncbi:MAG TPA: S8 family serine peptidase [Acidimicrobiales bacterium]|nr:S8 family serine peptidase [Acidimicrobiales bacterium]